MEPQKLQKRLKIFAIVMVAFFALLIARLVVVQIVYGEDYQMQARENMIRLTTVPAARGEIYDRNGVVLAANELVYNLTLNPMIAKQQEGLLDHLMELLVEYYPEITVENIAEQLGEQTRLFEPVVILRDIPWDLVIKLEERRLDLPGVMIDVTPLRSYPQQSLAGHAIGYIHSITAEEIKASDLIYTLDSLIGKSGLEYEYESFLKGIDGAWRVETDAMGRPISEVVTLEPTPGHNLYLTLDVEMQAVLENSMQNVLNNLQRKYPMAQVGSAVVMNATSGSILAITSLPNLNPDDFKGDLSNEMASYYYPQGSYDPMNPGAGTNRVIQAIYPPGSTFKPITGMAALEMGIDPMRDYVTCAGAYWIAPYIRCTGVHGRVNYYSAMAHSCNIYFQEMGRRAGIEESIYIGKEVGLGDSRSGIDLPFEASGNLPSPEWKQTVNSILIDQQYDYLRERLEDRYDELFDQADGPAEFAALERRKASELAQLEAQYEIDYNFETRWQVYDTLNTSIGQGSNNYTVVALARYVAVIANGGYLVTPHLVQEIRDASGQRIDFQKWEEPRRTGISDFTIQQTREAMTYTTQSGGTASQLFRHFPANIPVAAKTGTAETGRQGDRAANRYHGVFIAFAPADNPEIVFAGVVEYGDSGSGSAGLVARDVFEYYFGIAPSGWTPLSSGTAVIASPNENIVAEETESDGTTDDTSDASDVVNDISGDVTGAIIDIPVLSE